MHSFAKKRVTRLTAIALLLFLILSATVHGQAQPTASEPQWFVQVEAGTYYSVGLRKDGSVWVWGRNLWGELGIQEKPSYPAAAAPVRVKGLSNIVSIASYEGRHFAVKSDGTLWEWGGSAPRQVAGLAGVRSAAAVNKANLALLRDGQIVTWVAGGPSEVIGKGGVNAGTKTIPVPEAVMLAVSGDTALALAKDGSVWWWKEAVDNGKLAATAPARVPGLPRMKQISASQNGQAYGLDGSGRVWSWSFESVYTGSDNTIKLLSKPANAGPDLKAKQVKAGSGYALVLTTKGEVWTIVSYALIFKTGRVSGLSDIRAVAAGGYHGLAIDNSGRVWGWGADKWFEVGNAPVSSDGMVYKPILARPAITVKVNGRLLDSVYPAVAANETVFLPVKDTALAVGAEFTVTTDSSGRKLLMLKYGGKTAVLNEAGDQVVIDGTAVSLPRSAGLGWTATASYRVFELLGISVTWDENKGVISFVTLNK